MVLLLLFVLKTLSSGIISEHSTIVAYHQFNKCHADIDNVWVSVEICYVLTASHSVGSVSL